MSVVSLALETKAAAVARAGDQAPAAALAAAPAAAAAAATGRVSAAASAAVSVSLAPEAAVLSLGSDEDLWSMHCPVLLQPVNLAAKADGSNAECRSKAGCTQQPAVEYIRWAAVGSAAASPSAWGWNELLCTLGGCSWGKALRHQAAAAAKASECCTWCIHEACSVLAVTLGTVEAETEVGLAE